MCGLQLYQKQIKNIKFELQRHCTYIQHVCFNTSVNSHKIFYFLKKLGAQLIQQHSIQDNTIVFIQTNTGILSCTFTGLYMFAGPVGLCHEKFLFLSFFRGTSNGAFSDFPY
jgi:hypothetical protein